MIIMLIAAASLSNCGSANFNKIFGSKDDSYDALLQRAEMAYDRGRFDDAEEFATKAYAAADNNGEAAVLLGSIMLSQAGIDIFELVGQIAEISQTTASPVSSSEGGCSAPTGDSKSSATGLLTYLSCKLLNLTEADLNALGTKIPLTSPGLSPLGSYFSPALVTEELRQKVKVLSKASKGISFLCPFVKRDTVLKDSTDTRHAESVCQNKTGQTYNSSKAHISFALLHFVETLVYQNSILIDSQSGSDQVGITKIANQVNGFSFTNVSDFVATTNEFKTVIDNVSDAVSPSSQLALAVNGLVSTTAAFAEAGVPESITKSITDSLAKLREAANKLSQANSGASSNYQAQAFKGQLNEKLSQSMSSKINSVCASSACSAEQISSLCQSYAGISQSVDVSKVSKPTVCN